MEAVGPICGLSGAASVTARSRVARSAPRGTAAQPSRALVRVEAPPPLDAWRPAGRPVAAFVAHLIAGNHQAPQTRVRRRAAPAEAIASYVGTGRSVVAAGGAVARSA